jgi:hypothetical protein
MRSLTMRIVPIVGFVIVLAPPPLAAQDWSRMFKAPEVVNYTLTMDKVRKFVAAQRAIADSPSAASQLDGEFKALQKSNPQPTLADVTALVDRQTTVRNAIVKAGFTTQDYLLTSWAVGNAGIHRMLSKNGTAPGSAAQKANVALLEQNATEWEKLQQEMRQIAEKAVATGGRR